MSRWQEQFEQHPVHASLKELRELVSIAPEDKMGSEFAEHRRFLKILDAYEDVLQKLDPELIPFNQLDSLNDGLRQPNLWQEATNYQANGNADHLATANNQLATQLTPLALLLSMAGRVDATKPLSTLEKLVDELAKGFSEKRRSLEEEVSHLSDVINKQEQQITELSGLIETRKQETNTLTSDWQQQFSAAQESRSTEFNAFRQDADKTMSELKQQFSNTQEKLKTDFETWQKEIEAKATTDTQALIDATKEVLDNTLADADEKHKAILELYELTAVDSVGAGYTKSAKDDKKQANIWRLTSIGFIVATAAWLVTAYFLNTGIDEMGGIVWPKLFMALSLSGVLMWGGAYSAQQSTKHRNSEKRAIWFALEVGAIDPFIHSLEEGQRNELKKQLSERLFGHSATMQDDNHGVVDEHIFKVVVDGIVKIMSKLPKG